MTFRFPSQDDLNMLASWVLQAPRPSNQPERSAQ